MEGVVTNAALAWITGLVDTALPAAAIQSGTGTTAPARADTALQTPVQARVGGLTRSRPKATVLQLVGTITYTAATAVTEVGLFVDATTGAMLQRHVFAVNNMAVNDSFVFTIEQEQL